MPNRWIRERCRSSQSLANLSDKAERLFWRLTTVADDFGRFEAEPEIVQSECFKRAANRPSLTDVNKCLQMLADENIVKFYNQNNKLYGVFDNWELHQGKPRADKSKYPNPVSVRRCLHMQTNALVSVSESVSEDYKNNLTSPRESIGAPQVGADMFFTTFWDTYPRKVGKEAARKAWKKINPSETLAQQIIDSLPNQITSEQWQKEDGQFIPYPATWLNQGRWEDEPVQIQPKKDKGVAATAAWLEGKRAEKGIAHG